ncbi:phage portal protein [Parabacteroides pacaensis]|uniref:phage portal protein n=1 Tax=Parabacteroides pacaensis TaxID=2086575 RepID=UPI000D0FEB57|nr:phage portal protein [Parabacteroides pacaensis]
MNLSFWKRKDVPVPEEKPRERGYFETVVSPDVTIGRVGEPVPKVEGPEQAMRLATVYRCTSILSGSIAALPLQLKRKRNGYFLVDEDSGLNYLLTRCPNNRQTAFELMRNAVIQMVNMGNAYIYPKWWDGELDSLVLLSPGSVSYDKLLNIYLVNDPVNNIYETLECEDIIHLRNMSLDGGYTGVSTIRYAGRVMSVSASADSQSLDSFQPGSSYSGFVSGENVSGVKGFGEFQDDQLKTVGERVERELRSGKKIFWLPDNMKFSALSMSPADIQLLETKKFSVLDICRFYGVHPDKAFAGQSQNYKASEMSQVQFMTDTLQPILRQIEGEFYAKLIPRSVADKYRIEFDLEAFYQTDLQTMAGYMEKSIQYGVNTVNEWRKKRGNVPVEGGDKAFISCNVAPIDSAKIRGENILENSSQNAQNLPPKTHENKEG